MLIRIMDSKLKLILIITIAFMLLVSTVIAGCKIQDEKQATGEKNSPIEEILDGKASQSQKEVILEVKDISVDEAYNIVNSGQDYMILDVRTTGEFNEDHIEGAVLIPVLELENRLNELPKDKPIIVYCKIGGRSSTAANILMENSFTEIYNMTGGITDWIDKGYPIVNESN